LHYCNIKSAEEPQDGDIFFAKFNYENLEYKLNMDLFDTVDLRTAKSFSPSLKSIFSASDIKNEWISFDLDLMKLSTKDLDTN
jgi:hypothetical protein